MGRKKAKFRLTPSKGVPTPEEIKKYSDDHPTLYRELALAITRLGEGPFDRVRWLLAFVDMDIEHLSQGRLTDLRWEILASVSPPAPWSHEDKRDMIALLFWQNAKPLIEIELAGGTPTRDDNLSILSIKDIQSQLSQKFDDYFLRRNWTITRPSRQETIGFKMGGKRIHFDDSRSISDQILIWAFDLIHAKQEWIGLCGNPRCQRRFISTRKGRAAFCSPKCSAYVRIKNKRDAEAEARKKLLQEGR